ncbi:MAG: hypothetical protein KAS53_05050 [Candidatus Cloacimonetes bacterium]|nr:hypothetical protein [Candidatus Cloacimonadota bacterium]
MESEGLRQFLKTVGDAVYLLNTICVGLDGVSKGLVTKSDSLTISWKSSDPMRTAMSARKFAVRSALIFVNEALLNYIEFLADCSLQDPNIVRACNSDGATEKIKQLSKQVNGQEIYWLPFVILLIRWRNKVVHNSSSKLSPLFKKILTENSNIIKKRHAGINVYETIQNFAEQKITLKDFSTMIAVTIKFVRFLDKTLYPSISNPEVFISRIIDRKLVSIYKRIIGVNGLNKQKSKFKSFLSSTFPSIGEGEFDTLFKNRFILVKEIDKRIHEQSEKSKK